MATLAPVPYRFEPASAQNPNDVSKVIIQDGDRTYRFALSAIINGQPVSILDLSKNNDPNMQEIARLVDKLVRNVYNDQEKHAKTLTGCKTLTIRDTGISLDESKDKPSQAGLPQKDIDTLVYNQDYINLICLLQRRAHDQKLNPQHPVSMPAGAPAAGPITVVCTHPPCTHTSQTTQSGANQVEEMAQKWIEYGETEQLKLENARLLAAQQAQETTIRTQDAANTVLQRQLDEMKARLEEAKRTNLANAPLLAERIDLLAAQKEQMAASARQAAENQELQQQLAAVQQAAASEKERLDQELAQLQAAKKAADAANELLKAQLHELNAAKEQEAKRFRAELAQSAAANEALQAAQGLLLTMNDELVLLLEQKNEHIQAEWDRAQKNALAVQQLRQQLATALQGIPDFESLGRELEAIYQQLEQLKALITEREAELVQLKSKGDGKTLYIPGESTHTTGEKLRTAASGVFQSSTASSAVSVGVDAGTQTGTDPLVAENWELKRKYLQSFLELKQANEEFQEADEALGKAIASNNVLQKTNVVMKEANVGLGNAITGRNLRRQNSFSRSAMELVPLLAAAAASVSPQEDGDDTMSVLGGTLSSGMTSVVGADGQKMMAMRVPLSSSPQTGDETDGGTHSAIITEEGGGGVHQIPSWTPQVGQTAEQAGRKAIMTANSPVLFQELHLWLGGLGPVPKWLFTLPTESLDALLQRLREELGPDKVSDDFIAGVKAKLEQEKASGKDVASPSPAIPKTKIDKLRDCLSAKPSVGSSTVDVDLAGITPLQEYIKTYILAPQELPVHKPQHERDQFYCDQIKAVLGLHKYSDTSVFFTDLKAAAEAYQKINQWLGKQVSINRTKVAQVKLVADKVRVASSHKPLDTVLMSTPLEDYDDSVKVSKKDQEKRLAAVNAFFKEFLTNLDTGDLAAVDAPRLTPVVPAVPSRSGLRPISGYGLKAPLSSASSATQGNFTVRPRKPEAPKLEAPNS
jgi:hypothetical protein